MNGLEIALRGRSPAEVDRDSAWELVADRDAGTYPPSIEHVVRHRVSGALFACIYAIRADASDYEDGAWWHEVVARHADVVEYVRKR